MKNTFRHRIGKRIVSLMDSTVNIAVLVLLLLLFLLGCYSLWDSHLVYSQADAAQYEIYKPSNDEELPSFVDLQKINPEVLSWLTVNRTGIDYPVTQADNNEKYVNTDVFGKYSLTGSLFLDYQNQPDYSDFNSIIFGHHMEKDKMFGDLDKFRKENFFNSHKYGNLFYDGRDHGLEFFAFIEGDAYDSYLYSVGIEGQENQQAYLNMIYEKATYTRDIGVTTEDHIVLLSTCSSDSTNGRYLLVGRITDRLYPDDAENVGSDGSIHGIDSIGGLWRWILGLPWWVWLVLFIWIILLIILLCWLLNRRRRKRQQAELEEDGEAKKKETEETEEKTRKEAKKKETEETIEEAKERN